MADFALTPPRAVKSATASCSFSGAKAEGLFSLKARSTPISQQALFLAGMPLGGRWRINLLWATFPRLLEYRPSQWGNQYGAWQVPNGIPSIMSHEKTRETRRRNGAGRCDSFVAEATRRRDRGPAVGACCDPHGKSTRGELSRLHGFAREMPATSRS